MNISDLFKKLAYSMTLRRKLIIFFLIISLIPIVSVSYWAYDSGKKTTENRELAHLTSVADLKKEEIEHWVIERTGDLIVQSEDPAMGIFLSGGEEERGGIAGQNVAREVAEREVRKRLDGMIRNYGYKRGFITDVEGRIVLSTEKEDEGKIINEHYITMPIEKREIHVSEVSRSEDDRIVIVFSIPIYGFDMAEQQNTYDVVGVLALEMDMGHALFPMLENWPLMGKTGEILLVRREGDDVLFLNELRHRENSALNLRIPITSDNAKPAIFASAGDEGILMARDYRGVKVLSAYRHIRLTGWGFVAKVDQDEAFAAVTALRNRILAFSSVLIVLATVSAVWISKSITGPIKSLEKSVDKIALGDYSVQAPETSKDEIGRLAIAFNRMAGELKDTQERLVRSEKLAMLGQLSGSVGHEIRNPLAAISNSVYYLNMKIKDPDEKVEKHLSIMKTEILRADQIISDLLDFSRGASPALVKGDVSDIIKEVLEGSCLPDYVTVDTEFASGLPKAIFDINQMRQVFSNLISNAVQAMPEGGTLEITTTAKDGFVETKVIDSGEGIAEDNLKKVFEPLFTTKSKGIGLGLAIVEGIIERHNGKIEVESRAGKGTTFIIKLPVGKVK